MFILIDYEHKDLFTKSHIDKQIKIVTEDGSVTITNSDVERGQFELSESLCSESELQFGLCEASVLKFKIHNVFTSLTGKRITVTETLEGNTDKPFQLGKYKIFSDVPTADRKYRDITAYDAMFDILNADVSEWYNMILPNKDSKVSLKQFRTSFIEYFGLQQEETDLINDSMIVEKTIDVYVSTEEVDIIGEALSGKDVITAICEINGCFGHIGRDGKFKWIYLAQNIQGLYPSNDLFPDHAPDYLPQAETGHLYPQDPKGIRLGKSSYIKCQYEDYFVKQINKIQIKREENDVGAQHPENKIENINLYVIENNFLVYGKNTEQLKVIAENIFNKITGIVYIPVVSCEAVGNPCLEVGDPIRFYTKEKIIESYILKRTLKGIQASRDTYASNGLEYRSGKLNSVNRSIIQLKGKTNILIRDVEETRSEIKDVEKGLQTQITQNAENIEIEATRATEAEGILSGRIEVNANNIDLRVTKDGVIGAINISPEKIKIAADKIEFEGMATFNDNVIINPDGTIEAENGKFSGEVNADSGNIGGFEINQNFLGNSDDSKKSLRLYSSSSNPRLVAWAPGYETTIKPGAVYVHTGAATDGIIVDNGSHSNTNTRVKISHSSVNVKQSDSAYCDVGQGTITVVSGGSTTTIGGGGVTTTSDSRLKENIQENKKSFLDIISKLRIYTFNYKHDNKKRTRFGFIAQEIVELFKKNNIQKTQFVQKNETGYYSIFLQEFIPVLFDGWKDNRRRIEKMENEIFELKKLLRGRGEQSE